MKRMFLTLAAVAAIGSAPRGHGLTPEADLSGPALA